VTLIRIAILLDVHIVYARCMVGGWLAGISKRLATSLVMVHGIQVEMHAKVEKSTLKYLTCYNNEIKAD